MGNEEFLFLSYGIVLTDCTCLALAAWVLLRRPLTKVADKIPRGSWAKAVRRSCPASILLSALAGFTSVSYYGCPRESYSTLISSRAHIVAIGGRQISESLYSVVLAIFFWTVAFLMALVAVRRTTQRVNSYEDGAHDGGKSAGN